MPNRTPKLIQIPLPIEGETIEIPLTKGYVTIVDAIDGDLASFLWRVQKHTSSESLRACRQIKSDGHTVPIFIHRVILSRMLNRDLNAGEFVDHIDGNPLNNRRSNLRIATHTQNMQNRKLNVNNTSGHKGVWADGDKWRAAIRANGVKHCLGMFKTKEAAAEAYALAAEKLHGEFRRK